MSDSRCTSRSSIVLWILSLIPNNLIRYIALGLVSAWFIVASVHLQNPTARMQHLEDAIKSAEETLERAKSNCARNRLDLGEGESRLLHYRRPRSRPVYWNLAACAGWNICKPVEISCDASAAVNEKSERSK
ncbi:hypothetical protein DFH09DRAFT_1075567 [Mycena vulgaris]|nr:hypothetical protein DFH09DRAFT_1075567 [Mycena vulgaris]